MFTIKRIQNNGVEQVFNADWFEFNQDLAHFIFHDSEYGCLPTAYSCDYIDSHTIKSGRIYVMNDKGKTVAVYNLDVPRPDIGKTNTSRECV